MKLQRLFSLTCLTLAVAFAGFSGTASAQGANVLQVATDATFLPMEFTENGARTGFDIDQGTGASPGVQSGVSREFGV
jgi:polar amino acid transport system substrate-binding protein